MYWNLIDAFEIRQAKMEMETEDDVLVEGSGDTSSTSTTNLVGREIQSAVIDDAEMSNEELHSGIIIL
jgi:hypothetical protein